DDTVRGKPWWDVFLPEESRPNARAYCRMMNAGADQLTDETEWMSRDGKRLVIRSTSQRVREGDGSLRFLICGQDLTELVGQRRELEPQRDFLSAVGRATPSLLVIVERDGTVASAGT